MPIGNGSGSVAKKHSLHAGKLLSGFQEGCGRLPDEFQRLLDAHFSFEATEGAHNVVDLAEFPIRIQRLDLKVAAGVVDQNSRSSFCTFLLEQRD